MGVGQELTNGLKGVGHVFSFMQKQKKSPPPPHINNDRSLNRFDFSFGHSIFSLLMVNSKGGSLSILILFSSMKSTSKFPTLKSKAIFSYFLPFLKIAFLVYIDALW